MKRDTVKRGTSQSGFTLIEAIVAILVLTIGVTAVAAVFANNLGFMAGSQNDLIAKVKAQEAIESVFAGRDDQTLTWSQILNVNGSSGTDGGIFLDGPYPVNDPGADGLVNTADDQPGTLEYIVLPGPDGVYGTADDLKVPLTQFKREIKIRNTAIPNLRTLTVTITYSSNGLPRTYSITTYISPFV